MTTTMIIIMMKVKTMMIGDCHDGCDDDHGRHTELLLQWVGNSTVMILLRYGRRCKCFLRNYGYGTIWYSTVYHSYKTSLFTMKSAMKLPEFKFR